MWGHFQTPETSQRVDNNRKKGAMYRKSKKNSTSQINILGKKSKSQCNQGEKYLQKNKIQVKIRVNLYIFLI